MQCNSSERDSFNGVQNFFDPSEPPLIDESFREDRLRNVPVSDEGVSLALDSTSPELHIESPDISVEVLVMQPPVCLSPLLVDADTRTHPLLVSFVSFFSIS